MKLYRYAFDKDGYYAGLSYPIDTIKGQYIWSVNTTETEPFWKDGFIPRFDLKHNNWVLEPRAERSLRLAVEREILSKLQEHIDQRFDSLKDYVLQANQEQKRLLIETMSTASSLVVDQNRQNSILIGEHHKFVSIEIISIKKSFEYLITLYRDQLSILREKPPTLWERFKKIFSLPNQQ